MDPNDLKSCPTQETERSLAESTQRTTGKAPSTAAAIFWMQTTAMKTDGEISSASEAASPQPNGKPLSHSSQKFLDELYTQGAKEPTEGPKSESSKKAKKSGNGQKRSRRKLVRNKPTPLTFFMLEDKSHVAICQLVLCNISEVSLNFKIKCIPGGNIVAAPVGNAHIAPHSQVRLRLTWTKADDLANWDELEAPKLLLITNFMDETDEEGESVNQTRLVAKISLSKKCNAINAPVEQLLLDAVGKSTEVSPFQKAMSTEQVVAPAGQNNPANNGLSKQFADFINGLSDRSLLILAAIFVGLLVLFK